jgi:hypothetical protein
MPPALLMAIGFFAPLAFLLVFELGFGLVFFSDDLLRTRGLSPIAWGKENAVLIQECCFIFGVNVFAIYLGQTWRDYRRQRHQSAVERI